MADDEIYCIFWTNSQEPGADSVRNKDGILVDEFGLPQVPSSAK